MNDSNIMSVFRNWVAFGFVVCMMLIVALCSCSPRSRTITTYYPDGKTALCYNAYFDEHGMIVAHGSYAEYHSNGIKSVQIYIVNTNNTECMIYWYNNGVTASYIHAMVNGVYDGPVRTWWSNGFQRQVVYYNNGMLAGLVMEWTENGSLICSGTYKLVRPYQSTWKDVLCRRYVSMKYGGSFHERTMQGADYIDYVSNGIVVASERLNQPFR